MLMVQASLNELSQHVDGLQKSTRVIRDEFHSTTNLASFQQLELKSLYYQDMIEGLQTFEKIERLIETVEFLYNQENLLSASVSFKQLKECVQSADIKQFLQEYVAYE